LSTRIVAENIKSCAVATARKKLILPQQLQSVDAEVTHIEYHEGLPKMSDSNGLTNLTLKVISLSLTVYLQL